jgi:hypothetical protein
LDGDRLANPCDPDDDGDGWLDERDNCPLIANADQWDWDDNDIGFACDPAEREAFGVVVNEINDTKFKVNPDYGIPVPICPECVANILPDRWESVIDVQLPVPFQALIVDSSGDTAAKTSSPAVSQVVSFNPAPYAKSRLVGATVAEGETTYDLTPDADELRYYLILEPAPGTDLSQEYELSLSITEGIEAPEPVRLFLPALIRR